MGRSLSSEREERGIQPGIVQIVHWYRSSVVGPPVMTGLIADGTTTSGADTQARSAQTASGLPRTRRR